MTGRLEQSAVLPEWAMRLADECPNYQFGRQRTANGSSVVAERIGGTGPLVVITAHEDEMRQALTVARAPQI